MQISALPGDGIMALFGAPIAHEDAPEVANALPANVQATLRAAPVATTLGELTD